MADIRIKDLAVTAGSSASDDYLAVDGSTNGTRKLSAYSPTFGGNLTVSGTGNSSVAGNLGIGETSPAVPLHVKTTGTGTGDFDNAIATLRSTAAGRTITLQFSDTTNQSYISSKSGALNFGVGGATLGMSLSSGGNLTVSGTGTSSFAGNVTVTGTGTNYTAVDTGSFVRIGNNQTGANLQLGSKSGTGGILQGAADGVGAYALVAQPYGGNLLIGTTTDGGQKLQVSGTGAFTGDVTFGSLAAKVGLGLASYAEFSNYSTYGTSNFCLLQSSAGATFLNAGSGQNLSVRIGNSDALVIDSSKNATFAGQVMSAYTGDWVFKALPTSGADRNLALFGVSGATNGLTVKWNHSTSTLRINLSNLPTSSSGLAAGDLYNSGGTIKIA